jgi:hypothetical protein
MLGLLIDEEEFEISPAISRQLTLFEFTTNNRRKRAVIEPSNPTNFNLDFTFVTGNTQLTEVFRYTVDLKTTEIDNISSYDVYINSNYVGTDLTTIQINDGDTFLITVTKIDLTKKASIKTVAYLV